MKQLLRMHMHQLPFFLSITRYFIPINRLLRPIFALYYYRVETISSSFLQGAHHFHPLGCTSLPTSRWSLYTIFPIKSISYFLQSITACPNFTSHTCNLFRIAKILTINILSGHITTFKYHI